MSGDEPTFEQMIDGEAEPPKPEPFTIWAFTPRECADLKYLRFRWSKKKSQFDTANLRSGNEQYNNDTPVTPISRRMPAEPGRLRETAEKVHG